jgi:protein-tyrosine sulfotransferase
MFGQLIDVLKGYKDPRNWVMNILWRFPGTISDIDVVFVVGAPRSGTTLLQRILSVHPGFFTIQGETGMFSLANIFSLERRHFGLPDSVIEKLFAESADVVDFFQKSVKLMEAGKAGGRFVEKTPQHVLRLPFILKHFPRAHLIHLVRDGRDCYCSARHYNRIPQNTSVERFARYWKRCVDVPIRFANHPQLLTVRYEDLVAYSSTVVPKIMEFLGVEMEAKQISPEFVGRDKRSDHDEFSRLKEDIGPRTVNRWTEELPVADQAKFVTIARKQLEYYGYKIEPRL